jgi:hypothetical protein
MDEFDLVVTFTGLNLFLLHTNGTEAAVLQPDCRFRSGHMKHKDGSVGAAHVGYLRFDLASLCGCLPPGPLNDPPQGEGVYRFSGQTLDFGVTGNSKIVLDPTAPIGLPDFAQFAPTLTVPADLFSATPTHPLLMRSLLRGGTLRGNPTKNFPLPQVLNTTRPAQYTDAFGTKVTWTRSITGTGLVVTTRDFAGNVQAEFKLSPVTVNERKVIVLKVVNLCEENPLEWDEYEYNGVLADDQDFKWLYRLLDPPTGNTYQTMLLASPLPIPRLAPGGAGVENCIGGLLKDQSFTFPDAQ